MLEPLVSHFEQQLLNPVWSGVGAVVFLNTQLPLEQLQKKTSSQPEHKLMDFLCELFSHFSPQVYICGDEDNDYTSTVE